MFAKLGDLINRIWAVLLLSWIVIVVVASRFAPDLWEVVQTEEFAFLPSSSPSLVAENLFREAFPQSLVPSRIVIVVRRSDGGLTDADWDWVDDGTETGEVNRGLKSRLLKLAEENGGLASESLAASKPDIDQQDSNPAKDQLVNAGEHHEPAVKAGVISSVRTFRDKTLGRMIKSSDGKATLVLVELTTDFLDANNQRIVGLIEELLLKNDGNHAEFRSNIPPGLELSLSGEATFGRDMQSAARDSAKATETLTVGLVVFLLFAIYRAPLLAFIPLVTVFISVKLSMALLKLLAQYKLATLFPSVDTYVTVLVYGAGVDYCLFLIDRYKEELDEGMSFSEAIANSISKVGAAIAASAGTVICGIGMMMFAEFGKFRQAGFAISFGLTVVLLASLTFTPALLRMCGRWAFWPQMRTERVSSTGGWLPTASLSSQLSQVRIIQNLWDHVGELLVRRPMTTWVTSIVLMLPFAIIGAVYFSHLSYGLLSDLPASSVSVQGTKVVREHFAAGATGPVTILIKNDRIDFSQQSDQGIIGGLDLINDLTIAIANEKSKLQLADVRSASHPFGGDESVFEIKPAVRRKVTLEKSLEHYVSRTGRNSGHVTRLELTTELDPFARDSISHLTRLQQEIRLLLPEALRDGTEIFVTGSTASIRDLKSVTDRDQIRIDALVVVVVFLILIALLRQTAVCAYLMVTVLFSYLATLGATYGFYWMLDPSGFAGLDWKVPMFLFTILIAVGEDYNIFLMTRIDEEQKRLGPVQGIIYALSKTGRIISSCGIIMAGTFASLTAGSLKGMCQLGFALAFGVILDTFVIRPILVPAYLVLLNTGRFGRLSGFLGAVHSGNNSKSMNLSPKDDDLHPPAAS